MGKLAIIGGSGIQDDPQFHDAAWTRFDSQLVMEYYNGFGDGFVDCRVSDDLIFIPRHGRDTDDSVRYGPSRTQYAANLIAAKMLGATAVVAFSAVGSLRGEKIHVKDLVIPDTYDNQSGRDANLFGIGFVVHSSGHPAFSEGLRELLIKAGRDLVGEDENRFHCLHEAGTYVCIPGDDFGTKAEGYRRAREGADIVGMTLCPEARMAIQLDLPYACVALPVDLDLDANHERSTLRVMGELGPVVQEYIRRLVPPARAFAEQEHRLPQLEGGIIAQRFDRILNPYLHQFAHELQAKYCTRS